MTASSSDIGGTPGSGSPLPGRWLRWNRLVTSSAFIGVALTVLTWPYSASSLIVPNGLDSSWQTALAIAAHAGIPFRTHIVFTYGPLGFLQNQQVNYVGTSEASFVFNFALSSAVLGTMVWSLRRAVPLVVAAAVAYIFGATLQAVGAQIEDVLALVLVACVAVLIRSEEDPAPPWVWMALGGVLSVFALVKVSFGVGIAAALILTVACLPSGRWRVLGYVSAGAIPTFLLCWFGTGNSFGNIIAFARSSIAIIGGYAPVMSLEVPSRAYTYGVALPVVVLIGAFAAAHGSGLPQRARIRIGLATLVIVWMVFKEGFVRHDAHDLIFFAAAPLVLVAFAPRRRSWALAPGVLMLTGLFLIAAIGVLPLVPRPDVAVQNFSSEAATIASAGRTAAVIEQSRRSLQNLYALPNQMVALDARPNRRCFALGADRRLDLSSDPL